MSTATRTTQALAIALVDDAAVFPPGNAALPVALARHRMHRSAGYSRFVGPLLTRAADAGQLAQQLVPGERLPVVIVVRPGSDPAVLPAAVAALRQDERAEVAAVEAPLGAALASPEIVLALGTPAWLEVPADDDGKALGALLGLRSGAEGVAGTSVRAKLRTGGRSAAEFPDERQVAAFVVGCARRGLPFKLTAGLHHAVRHTDAGTGFEHHGVANVLAATWASTDGATIEEVAGLLGQRHAGPLVDLLTALDGAAVAATRARFASFGCCDVAEPLADLAGLGLIEPALIAQPPDRAATVRTADRGATVPPPDRAATVPPPDRAATVRTADREERP